MRCLWNGQCVYSNNDSLKLGLINGFRRTGNLQQPDRLLGERGQAAISEQASHLGRVATP